MLFSAKHMIFNSIMEEIMNSLLIRLLKRRNTNVWCNILLTKWFMVLLFIYLFFMVDASFLGVCNDDIMLGTSRLLRK